MTLSHDALIFGLAYLSHARHRLSFGGDGASMAITPRARAALDELIAAGYATKDDPSDQIPNREHYVGVDMDPYIGILARDAGINPFALDQSFIAFQKKGAA